MTITPEELAIWAAAICKRTPTPLWKSICQSLRDSPKEATLDQVIFRFPSKLNNDLCHEIRIFLQKSIGSFTWSELGCCLQAIGVFCGDFMGQQPFELVWSGPASGVLQVRRTDQALYDLINCASSSVFLVTFAAVKVSFLQDVLLAAYRRGVRISMVLEFEQESGGQLRIDAIAAFPKLASVANIYYWPYEKRELNVAGNPGKLHAKCAIVDDSIIIGSANLTEDAFNRNMEIGLLIKRSNLADIIRVHFEELIKAKILQPWPGR